MTDSKTSSTNAISRDDIRQKFGELREGVDSVRDSTEGKARKYAIAGGVIAAILLFLVLRRRRSTPRALVEVYRV